MTILARTMIFFILLTGIPSFAAENIEPPRECKQCGMSRVAFANSRMLVVYADGTSVGICSLNCAVIEMKANKTKKVKFLKVADYGTGKLIDARAAIWVIGGNKQGVMTEIPKWAFAKREDAQKFVKASGGRITDFDEALNLALRENQ